jgi:NCS1 nucleoside transporter family
MVETRSIDYVPIAERFGKVSHLGPVWFQGNAVLSTLAVGLLGISLGLNFAWSVVAIVLGTLFGTLFMAFHSAQGPKLGLPQMIQSRPQFGYYGSLLPVVTAVLLFVGFNVFNTAIGGEAVQRVTHMNLKVSEVLIAVLAMVFTYFGYRVIHLGLRYATYLFLAVYGVLTVGVFTKIDLPAAQTSFSGTFQKGPFLILFGVVMSYQLTWAPYVSEYSRYLPETTRTAATFWCTYLGCGLAAVWTMVLGAFVYAANTNLGAIEALQAAGDKVFDGFGAIVLVCSWPGVIAVVAMNMYSGALSTLTAVDVIKPVKPTVRARAMSILFIAVVATTLALFVSENFLTSYLNFLLFVLYFMIPWTAINLVDFFFIRREKYAVLEMFKPNGIYGAWNKNGLIAYVVGFLVMIPFFSNTIYTGPVATSLGGGDISPFIGGPVAAIVYYVLTRKNNVQEEWRLADAQRSELEQTAAQHERAGEPVG